MTSNFEIIFKQKIKYANILFSVYLFYLLGIFAFNSNIRNINETEKKLENRFSNDLKSIKRLELFEKNKNEFVKKYVFSEIQLASFFTDGNRSYLHLYDRDNLRPKDGLKFEIPQKNKDSINTIINNCGLFAEKFNAILKNIDSKNKSSSNMIKKSIDSIFNNKKISKILNKGWSSRLIDLMNNQTNSNVDSRFINYILTGTSLGYPDGGTVGGRVGVEKSSYLEMFKSDDFSEITEGKFYYSFLGNQSFREMKTFLLNKLNLSYIELSKFRSTDKKLSTNIFGVTIGFNYLFLLSGLILFFFLTLFYIYHNIESKKIEEGKLKREFLFPNFGITESPFQKILPRQRVRDFKYYFTNLVWLIFLLLPIGILFLGYIFRYNLTDLSSYSFNLEYLLYAKNSDFISFLGDLVNLMALFFSFWVFVDLTLLNNKKIHPKEKFIVNKWFPIISILLLIILSYLNILPSYQYFHNGIGILAILTNYLFLIQVMIWCILIYYSMKNNSFFGMIISFFAFLINIDLIINRIINVLQQWL